MHNGGYVSVVCVKGSRIAVLWIIHTQEKRKYYSENDTFTCQIINFCNLKICAQRVKNRLIYI